MWRCFSDRSRGGRHEQGEDPQGFFTGTGPEAQYADVDVVVQGRQYPPPPFGRTGAAAGSAMSNNVSQSVVPGLDNSASSADPL